MQKQQSATIPSPSLQTQPPNPTIHQSKNISYGIQIPSKQQLKQIKKKVQLLKQAILKQRSQRQLLQNQLNTLLLSYLETEQLLQKKQQKNQILLHQSRQLKDILIRQKQQIKNLQSDIQTMKDKKRKQQNINNSGTTFNVSSIDPGTTTTNPQGNDWKSYFTSFWK